MKCTLPTFVGIVQRLVQDRIVLASTPFRRRSFCNPPPPRRHNRSYTTSVSESGDGFPSYGWHNFFFQWSFCAATTTILSGAVAERCNFVAYLLYSFYLSSFVYPVVVHWVWSSTGWLSAFNR